VSLYVALAVLRSFPTRRSSDLAFPSGPSSLRPPSIVMQLGVARARCSDAEKYNAVPVLTCGLQLTLNASASAAMRWHSVMPPARSEEHTSELQSRENLVCRLLL